MLSVCLPVCLFVCLAAMIIVLVLGALPGFVPGLHDLSSAKAIRSSSSSSSCSSSSFASSSSFSSYPLCPPSVTPPLPPLLSPHFPPLPLSFPITSPPIPPPPHSPHLAAPPFFSRVLFMRKIWKRIGMLWKQWDVNHMGSLTLMKMEHCYGDAIPCLSFYRERGGVMVREFLSSGQLPAKLTEVKGYVESQLVS